MIGPNDKDLLLRRYRTSLEQIEKVDEALLEELVGGLEKILEQ